MSNSDPNIEEEDFNDEFDGEEEEFEDDNEVSTLPPDHPLLKKIQADLKKQLDTMYDTIEVALREKNAEREKYSTEREQVGVELYSIQQTLAKLQNTLSAQNEKKMQTETERHEQESKLQEARQTLETSKQELTQRTKEYEQNRRELEKLNEVIIALEQHNQEIKNQVAVTRRETYKAEQSASETEVSKQEQDLYIDKLTHQIHDITADLGTIEAQIIAQRNETKTARDALLQASLEMEKINFERNHLIQDWNSSLISVKKRIETLNEIEEAAKKQEEEIRSLDNENEGLKIQIQNQHDISEKNQILMNKITSRLGFIKNKIEEVNNEREKLQEQLNQLYTLTQEKENLISKLLIDRNNANYLFKQSLKGTNEISNKIHQIEDKIIEHVTNQTNLKKEAVSAQNAVEKVREEIHSKEKELIKLQNEVVRLRIDKLNIKSQSEKLQNGLKEIIDELKEKDNLINQYELQIHRNNFDIEKRQSEVDKLNRKYEALKAQQNGEEYSPLERKIRVLQGKIEQTDIDSQENQAIWLKKQAELVSLEHQCENLQEKNNITTAHIAVLTRKRDRTLNQLKNTEKEINKLQVQTHQLQREISRLGQKLSQNSDSGNVLLEGNIHYEAEILENLKIKEEEAAQITMKIEEIVNNREQLADDLMETEKQIMLIEKKLVLAKEMKEALDPNYGSNEIKSMKKEISRMEVRLKQIKKQQQVIVQEMEYALKRRETIATRGAIKKRMITNNKSKDDNYSLVNFPKDILSLSLKGIDYEKEIIVIELVAIFDEKKEEEIAFMIFPLKICEYDKEVSGKFKLSPIGDVDFRGFPKMKISIHIGKKAFSKCTPMPVPLQTLSAFGAELNVHKLQLPYLNKLNSTSSSEHSTRNRRVTISSVERNPALIQTKIEEAMVKAPRELLKCFEDPEFIHRCLYYYGVKGDTHVRA
ncbi:coiled-coil domain-containing protein [Histomonas meleagridis]|uniref:coiled-coil domain-containing protein 40-like n=1 Tax=Histomonas meleagridis TaxID=135588 RepID=UPI00355AB7D5|nr:coiled-coil domain-containing protein [Histomonas meleagridis]KAH0801564.1 coiled-coil domain-containing protein 40-like [Histomonas meleagridis]